MYAIMRAVTAMRTAWTKTAPRARTMRLPTQAPRAFAYALGGIAAFALPRETAGEELG